MSYPYPGNLTCFPCIPFSQASSSSLFSALMRVCIPGFPRRPFHSGIANRSSSMSFLRSSPARKGEGRMRPTR
jgi:hypothetical protein